MILGTAGHIDHGKTSLVRALTGVDTDRLPEEKRRGITIELGFAPLQLDGVGMVGIVDVPGHEAFVRTMVAGATGIDLALLVVAADEGVMPQTREHLAILELLGVRRGVVALTKSDLVDADWLALVTEDLRAVLKGILPDAPVVPTSTVSGSGVDALKTALSKVAKAIPRRGAKDLFRLPVDRAFTIKGTGTVVTGTVWSGSIERDQNLRILPAAREARVRAIQTHGESRDRAEPGSRAAIALAGVDVPDVPRGSVLVTDPEWKATKLARADVQLLPGADRVVRPRSWIRFHVGTSDVGVRVVGKPSIDNPSMLAARLVFDEPVVLRAGDRFILRGSAPLNTLGGGTIIDPYPPRRPRMWPVGTSTAQRLQLAVEDAGPSGLDPTVVPVRIGVPPADVERLVRDAGLVIRQHRVLRPDAATAVADEMLDHVKRYHRDHPLDVGISLQLLRTKLKAPAGVIDSIIAEQAAAGAIDLHGSAVALGGWKPTPTGAQAELVTRVMAALTKAGAEPPTAEELSASLNADASAILKFLERGGQVVEVERGRFYEASQLDALIAKLRAAMQGGGERSPSELRDALGLSRKYLIPLLEYADRRGYTRRGANGRTWAGERLS